MTPDEYERHRRKQRSSRPWARLVERTLRVHGTTCHICGTPGADSADHILPVAMGGRSEISNLAPVHHAVAPHCNMVRGSGSVEQARIKLGLGQPRSRDW